MTIKRFDDWIVRVCISPKWTGSVDYEVFEVRHLDAQGRAALRLKGEKDTERAAETFDLDNALVAIHGCIRWDGASHHRFFEHDDVYYYGDRSTIRALFQALDFAHAEAKRLMLEAGQHLSWPDRLDAAEVE